MTKDNHMVIGQYLATVKKWWWLLVASVLVASASSYVAVSRAPRIYQATTTVIVGQGMEKANPTYQDFSISQQLAQTYMTIVQRRPILEAAAEALGLSYVPWSGNISARIVPGTQLLEISVRDTAAERARALADEIAQQLILQTPTDSAGDRDRREFVQEQLANLEGNVQATQEEINEEQAKLDAATSARAIQQYQSNIAALQQKLASYQSGYAALLQAMQQESTNYISVVEPAMTPTRPISPQVMQTVLLAAAIGLGLALAGAFLIEFLDDTIKTTEDAARVTDLPLLGAIDRIAGDTRSERLIARIDSRSYISESFRALRTNIQFTSLDRPIRTLMVTSADPVEGKSLIMANLAVVMAQGGRSVLLVDADLRRPTQHELFGLKNRLGLSNALLEREPDLSAYGQQVAIDGLPEARSDVDGERSASGERLVGNGDLRVITSGPIPPNPADLLASERAQALLKALESQVDIVLVDAPPVLAATDAVVLSSRVDGVLMVTDAGHTRHSRAERAVERLRQVEANLIGVVLNRVPSQKESYYSYGYYHYGQGNGELGQSAQRGEQKKRGFALPRLRGRRTENVGSVFRRLSWWRTFRQAVTSGQMAQQQELESLDRWVGAHEWSGERLQEPGQRRNPKMSSSPEVEASKKTQRVRLGDIYQPGSEADNDGTRKTTRPLALDDPQLPESEATSDSARKKTQPLYLADPQLPEPEAPSDRTRKETQPLSLDDSLPLEQETGFDEDSKIDSPVQET